MKIYLTFLLLIIFVLSCSEELKKTDSKNEFSDLFFSHDIYTLNKDLKVFGGEKINIEIPIKIKAIDEHFQIKAKKKNTIYSKKAFNLFPVPDEVSLEKFAKINLFQSSLKKLGFIGLKSKFLNVVSGNNKNVMFFEEGFDKRIIESNFNREGILFSIENEQVNIKYNPTKSSDKELSKMIQGKINQWKNKEISLGCLIDLDKTGGYIALKNSFNTHLTGLSFGYYLNPVSNLIEPFSFYSNKSPDSFISSVSKDSTLLPFVKFDESDKELISNHMKGHKLSKYAPKLITIESKGTKSFAKCYSETEFLKYFIEENGIYTLKDKKATISSDVIIPAGLKVNFKKGLNINLINGGFILSFSPITMNGTAEDSIYVHSSDSTGRGLHVINTKEKSELYFVNFNNLSNLEYNDWKLPSAVTFYESPVEIRNSYFGNNNCEDAVNIFRSSPYLFDNCLIENTFSDAFDADFSNGVVSNSKILNSGNDGVDVSGSQLKIVNCEFVNIADKALSAGEESDMVVDSSFIDGASLAIVAKDLSKVDIKNSKITNSDVVFCAFQKKKEFGPSSIKSEKVEYSNFKEPNLIEEKSKLSVNGEKIHNYRDNVKKYLYGNEYGKETVK